MTLQAFVQQNIKPPTLLYKVEYEDGAGDTDEKEFSNQEEAEDYYRDITDGDYAWCYIYVSEDDTRDWYEHEIGADYEAFGYPW